MHPKISRVAAHSQRPEDRTTKQIIELLDHSERDTNRGCVVR
jgi:hypothetical protein